MAVLPRGILLFVAAHEKWSFTAAASRDAATQSGVSGARRAQHDRPDLRIDQDRVEAGQAQPRPRGEPGRIRHRWRYRPTA